MLWMIFIKTLKNAIQTKNIKYYLFDMINKKRLNPIVTELFIRGRKLNIPLVFITQSYFAVPKKVD